MANSKRIKEWRAENGDRLVGYVVKRFGLSVSAYDAMLQACDHRCEACGREVARARSGASRDRIACVDHDHTTGRVRGILCAACNSALGLLDDSPDRLLGLQEYLRKRVINVD